MADVRTKVNSIDSARNMTHAQRIANKMYNNNDFFAGGQVRLRGDHRVQVLTPIFLDGIGELWSAAYTAVEVTHAISNNGYTTDAVVYTNSVTGTENSKNYAQEQSKAKDDEAEPQVVFKRDAAGQVYVLPLTNPNRGSGN